MRWIRVLAALACSVGLLPAQSTSFGHKVVFRYRCFEGTRPGWVSPIDAVGGIDHSVNSADLDVTVRGNGFSRLIAADFNGSSEFIRARSSISSVDSAGHDSLTIQAWFRADAVTGWRTLVSNTQSYRGFSLKVHNGQLRGLLRLRNGGGHVNVEIRGGSVRPGHWHYAAFRVKEHGSSYDLRLFLDGDAIATKAVPHYGGVRQSSERPMVGAEPDAGTPSGDFFDGDLYAVSIANYAVGVENFLDNDLIRDASRYFGMVSYHDYLTTTEGPDHRISATIRRYPDVARLEKRFYCPLLNDNYVPQGVATDGRSRVFMTMYWRDADDRTGRHPSLLVECSTDGHLRRVFQLHDESGAPFHGHVGGVAYRAPFAYVPYGSSVLRFRVPPPTSGSIFQPTTFANPRGDRNPLRAEARYTCATAPNTGISFLSVGTDPDGSPTLWTGQFNNSAYRDLIGFPLSATGAVVGSSPTAAYKLPCFNVQGAYCYQSSCGHLRFYLATSYGDDASKLVDVLYRRRQPTAQSSTTVLTLPAGLEDLGMIGDRLWSVSESGARYFQKRTHKRPWNQLFPFMISCRLTAPPPPPLPARRFGRSCGGATIVSSGQPRIGGSYQLIGSVPAPASGATAVLVMGFRPVAPLSLAAFGFPGCDLNVAPEVTILANTPSAGRFGLRLWIPRSVGSPCQRMFHQWVVVDSSGLRASQGLELQLQP